jgi:hypothetical protein
MNFARGFLLVLLLLVPRSFAVAVNLAWDSSPDAGSGYKLYYALQDFVNAPADTNLSTVVLTLGTQTSASVSNVIPGLTYYFAVVAVAADGAESDFSNVVAYSVPDGNGLGLPPFPIGSTSGTSTSTGTTTGTSTGTSTGSSSGGSTTTGLIMSDDTHANLIGMLPRLWLYPTNGVGLLAISGTVGATFTIQSSTNPAAADSWITITNIKLSAIAPNASQSPGTTLEKAFIPALESFQDPKPLDGIPRFYRIFMPLGYAVLADQVLTQQNFHTRLVAVRLPGVSGYLVCYVTEETAYLDYNDKTYLVKLEPSGPTIREIASRVASSLSQNWTSVSEFKMVDGVKQLVATVVQTDDPSTDPLPGVAKPGSSIVIDF